MFQAGYYKAGYYSAGFYGIRDSVVVPDPPVVTSIVISPPSIDGSTGNTVVITATVYDQYGAEMPGAAIQFSSDDNTVATVAENVTNGVAVVTLISAGAANITAESSGGISDSILVTVAADEPPVFGGSGNIKIFRSGLKTIIIIN